MNRIEAMAAIAAARGDAAAVTGPGANSGLLYEQADRPATLYNMELGYSTSVALGVALACPQRPVMSIEGEGSFFAGSTVLSTIWRLRPSNLVVIVLDNEIWGTADGLEPTATAFGLDLARLALATGWGEAHVHRPADARALGEEVARALLGGGPHFIVGKIDPKQDSTSASGSRARPKRHILDCAVLMRATLTGDA
jgi:thiamine pyrophosphate-dependent acetolactate synthase large subunit-like protein